jgi:hypothetical protein
MRFKYSTATDSGTAPDKASDKNNPEPNLMDVLEAVLGGRAIACIGDWNDDRDDFVRPPLYLVHGDVVATFDDLSWEEIIAFFEAETTMTTGTILARNVVMPSRP